MFSRMSDARAYANLLTHEKWGHAVFNQEASSAMKPGTLGFFDETGEWNVIAQLKPTDTGLGGTENAPEAQWPAVADVVYSEVEGDPWSSLASEKTERFFRKAGDTVWYELSHY